MGIFDKIVEHVFKEATVKLVNSTYDKYKENHNAPWLALKKGDQLRMNGQFKEALPYLMEGLQKVKNDADGWLAYYSLGNCYTLLEDYNKGLEHSNAALAYSNMNLSKHKGYKACALYDRGCCYINLGQKDNALKDIKLAIELDSTIKNTLRNDTDKLLDSIKKALL